jgi:hypothetical protein
LDKSDNEGTLIEKSRRNRLLIEFLTDNLVAGRLLEKDVCGKCTREIFRFYRMNDVYGVGLVIFNILKTG